MCGRLCCETEPDQYIPKKNISGLQSRLQGGILVRKTAFAGLLLCVLMFLALAPSAHAETIALFEQTTPVDKNIELATEVITNAQEEAPAKPARQKVVRHTVAKGESLVKIANRYDVTWQKIYYKNTDLNDPDNIKTGEVLLIPSADAVVKKRKIPKNEPKPSAVQQTASTPEPANSSTTNYSSSAGNTYTYGYCTWYVKNRRPDLPNGLGNAYEWVGNAQAMGMATGSSPRAGAAGQRGNHVVYVEQVHGDGTVTVSEMNHVAWNVVSSRRVPASYFTYIY